MANDKDEFQKAMRDIQIKSGWQFFDFITVIFHSIFVVIIGSPLLILTIFLRVQQSSYSLVPPMRLIFTETILYYPSSIPAKLIADNWINKDLVKSISFLNLQGPVFNFVWFFTNPENQFNGDNQNFFIENFCETFSHIISVWSESVNQRQQQITYVPQQSMKNSLKKQFDKYETNFIDEISTEIQTTSKLDTKSQIEAKEISKKDVKKYQKNIINSIIQIYLYQNGNKEVKLFNLDLLYQLINNNLFLSNRFPKCLKAVFQIETRGFLQVNEVFESFLELNQRQDILFEKSDLKFFKQLAHLRNFNLYKDGNHETLIKSSITDIAEMLNLEDYIVELIINLVFSTNFDKLRENIPKSILNLIEFRNSFFGEKSRDMLKFLHPHTNYNQIEYKKLKEEQYGLVKTTQFIYLNGYGKSPQAILQYFKLFEMIHSYYCQDISKCCQSMVKYYRQIDYLNQQNKDSKKNTYVNNVTISDYIVEQYVRLINHMQFNTSFISKDTNIPIEAVETITNLMYIKYSKSVEDRNKIFESMKNNNFITSFLSNLKINLIDLISLIKIIYQDFDPAQITQISKLLNLPQEFKIEALQQLLQIDQIIENCDVLYLNKMIKANRFIKSYKIDTFWAEVAYVLCKGKFLLLPKYKEKLIPISYPSAIRFENIINKPLLKTEKSLLEVLNTDQKKYISLIQGLTGILSSEDQNFETDLFLKQLYNSLKQKFITNDSVKNDDLLKKSNTLPYAIYKFTKSTFISPLWALLMIGDCKAWEFLSQKYYAVKNNDNEQLNPVLALIYVINFRANPLIVNQLLVDLEYAQRSYQILVEKQKNDNLKEQELINKQNCLEKKGHTFQELDSDLNKFIKQILDIKTQINEILQNCLVADIEKINNLSLQVKFPQTIIDKILNDQLKYFKATGQHDALENHFQGDVIKMVFKNFQSSINKNDNYHDEFQSIQMFESVFQKINNQFYKDPRIGYSESSHKGSDDRATNQCLKIHIQSPIMQAVVLSTISQLRQAYYDFYGFSNHSQDHYQQVTFAIDLILSTLEKYYYFDDMMDFFPRHRLIFILGLSVGFVIDQTDVQNCITSKSVCCEMFINEVIKQHCLNYYDKIQSEDYKRDSSATGQKQREEIEDFIKNNKLKLKYNYFTSKIVNLDIKKLFKQNQEDCGVFKGIFYEEIRQKLIKTKNHDSLVYNYKEYMWDSMQQKDFLDHLVCSGKDQHLVETAQKGNNQQKYNDLDVYSGKSRKELSNQVNKLSMVSQKQDFSFLIDIYKQNYSALKQNDLFIKSYGKDCNLIYSIISLNGIVNKGSKQVQAQNFQQSINQVCQCLTSDKKALAEILSLFIPSMKQKLSILIDNYNLIEESLMGFVNLTMDKSVKWQNDLEKLLKFSPISPINKKVLKNCIKAYGGDQKQYLLILKYSPIFCDQDKLMKEIQKIISFERSQMHTIQTQQSQVNYIQMSNFSHDKQNNQLKAHKHLWELSLEICYQKWLKENTLKDNQKKEQFNFEIFKKNNIYGGTNIQDECFFNTVYNMIYEKMNFLFDKNQHHLLPAYENIFNLKKEHNWLAVLQLVSMTKAIKCNLDIKPSNIQQYINFSTVNQMIKTCNQLFQSKSEARYLYLLLNLANQSTINVVNSLVIQDDDKWNYLSEKEQAYSVLENEFIKEVNKNDLPETKIQEKLFQNYIFEQNKIDKQIEEKTNKQKFQINKIIQVYQSLFLWKNVARIDWEKARQQLKLFENMPFKYRNYKTQFDQLLILRDQLKVLPAYINHISNKREHSLYKRENVWKQNNLRRNLLNSDSQYIDDKKYFLNLIKRQHLASINLQIFSNLINQNNSIYLIHQSVQEAKIFQKQDSLAYLKICNLNPYLKDLNADQQKDQHQKCIKYISNLLNGVFLNKIKQTHPLVEYISDIYFKGFSSFKQIYSKNIQENLFNDGSFFIGKIFQEKLEYVQIFNGIMNILLMTSQQQMFQSQKISTNQQQNYQMQASHLIQNICCNLLQMDEESLQFIQSVYQILTNNQLSLDQVRHGQTNVQKPLPMIIKYTFNKSGLFDFFLDNFGQSEEKIEYPFNKIINLLQVILDKSSIQISDPSLVENCISLIKYISNNNIDLNVLKDVLKVFKGENEYIFSMLRRFEVIEESKIDQIENVFKQVTTMQIFDSGILNAASSECGHLQQSDQIKDIIQKLKDEKITIKDVFKAIDLEGDKNGSIDIDEFQYFARRLGITLSRHRVYEIFASVKNRKAKYIAAQSKDELSLNEEEFEQAFKYINEKKTSMSLEKLSISPSLLFISLVALLVILLLLFIFIFFGINAFANGGTFNSVINSSIPIIAGAGTSKSQTNKKLKLKDEEIKNAIKETQGVIHSDNV
ncbi:hypothetical protein ABPG73_017966 [Tetrahymena malaccensis]